LPKTIWIINQYAGSPLHGMEFRPYYLAKHLIQQGYSVTIISGSYSHLFTKPPQVNSNYSFEQIDGITYCWIKLPAYKKSTGIGRLMNMLVFAWKLRFLPLDKLATPDAIVVSSPSLFLVKQGKRLSKRFKAKFVFEVRDIWPLTLQELSGLSPSHPLMLWMQHFENFAYRNADKVISVLPGGREHMKIHGMSDNKFAYVPNGIDTDEASKAEPLTEFIKQQIPKNKFIIGYAGKIGIANALNYLIDAAKILSDNTSIHFVIVGDGFEKTNLMEQAKDLTNVTFINYIPKLEIAALLSQFDVCYLGWRRESLYRFGISANKTFDYMFAAKPIIHSVEAFNDAVAESGCGISVEPENSEVVAKAILELQRMSSAEREAMGQRGKSFVIQHHSYHNLAKAFADACFSQ